ncbi:hypothetical protein [Aphanizomenon flos-aquae]|nr:hypothetical protein [Aphanizomenon flos-aquae]
MIISNLVDKTANISLQKDTLLIELTAEESSSIVGGLTIRNDSGGTRRFL